MSHNMRETMSSSSSKRGGRKLQEIFRQPQKLFEFKGNILFLVID